MFDGVEKKSADHSIVYKGQMYVPTKFISQSVGKDFSYDGKNKTAWIGNELFPIK